MSRLLAGRLSRLARRLPPPPPAPGQLTAEELDALSMTELLARLEDGEVRWRMSTEGRALQAALDSATDEQLVEMWLRRPPSWAGHGGKGRR